MKLVIIHLNISISMQLTTTIQIFSQNLMLFTYWPLNYSLMCVFFFALSDCNKIEVRVQQFDAIMTFRKSNRNVDSSKQMSKLLMRLTFYLFQSHRFQNIKFRIISTYFKNIGFLVYESISG